MDFEQRGFIGGLSTKYYQSMSNKLILSEYVQQTISEGCPINFNIGECLMSFQKKKKNFCFGNSCHTWQMNV